MESSRIPQLRMQLSRKTDVSQQPVIFTTHFLVRLRVAPSTTTIILGAMTRAIVPHCRQVPLVVYNMTPEMTVRDERQEMEEVAAADKVAVEAGQFDPSSERSSRHI